VTRAARALSTVAPASTGSCTVKYSFYAEGIAASALPFTPVDAGSAFDAIPLFGQTDPPLAVCPDLCHQKGKVASLSRSAPYFFTARNVRLREKPEPLDNFPRKILQDLENGPFYCQLLAYWIRLKASRGRGRM